jgi:hypothetical protein
MKKLVRFVVLFVMLLVSIGTVSASVRHQPQWETDFENFQDLKIGPEADATPIADTPVYTVIWEAEFENPDAFSVTFPSPPPEGASPWAKYRVKTLAWDQDYKPISMRNFTVETVKHSWDGFTSETLRVTMARRVFFGKRPTKVTFRHYIEIVMVSHPSNALTSNARFDGRTNWIGFPGAPWAPKYTGIDQVQAVIGAITHEASKGKRMWPYAVQNRINPEAVRTFITPTDCEGSVLRFISALRAGGVPAWPLGCFTATGWHSVAAYAINGKVFMMDVEALLGASEPSLSLAQTATVPFTVLVPMSAGFEVPTSLHNSSPERGWTENAALLSGNALAKKIGGREVGIKPHPKVTRVPLEQAILADNWQALEIKPPTQGEKPTQPTQQEREEILKLATTFFRLVLR